MKFKEYGEYDPKVLETTQEIQLMNSIEAPLKRLNYFLEFLQEKKPEVIPQLIDKLQEKTSDLIKIDYFKIQNIKLTEILKDLKQLKNKPQLANLVVNFVFNLLELPEKLIQINDKLTVTHGNYLRSFLVPRYYNVMVLSELIGKEKAVKLYKIFRTEYTKLFTLRKNMYKDTDDFWKAYTTKTENEKLRGVFVMGTPENGKVFYRKDFCVWVESLKDLPDSDFKYLAACYGDFQRASTMQNENFLLTMKHTIMQGDVYCSSILHDTRIDWNLSHPSEEFWDSIWPLKEWQKKPKKKAERKFQREFQQLGFHSPETLDILDEIQPLDIAKKSSFNRLNYLLGFIKRNKPEKYNAFVENLEKTYASMVKVDYYTKNNQKYDIKDAIEELENLKEYKQLAINSLNYFLGLLEIPSDTDWVNEKLKIPKGNFFRSFLIPRYQNVTILTETIGREEAIRLYKIYRTEHAKISTPENRRFRFDTLEDLRKDDFDDYEGDGNPGWVRIEGIVENGKFVYRKDSCLYAEAMKDYPDTEFKFLAACYYDYQGTRIQWNKDFILTMEHTIAEGDSYCSCVVHDTRIDWDLTHPSKEYWDSIFPLQSWQKRLN